MMLIYNLISLIRVTGKSYMENDNVLFPNVLTKLLINLAVANDMMSVTLDITSL